MSRTHLVTGVAGQDGVLLARLLLRRGERVVGTVRQWRDGQEMACYLADVEIVEHDVRDQDGFRDLLEKHRPVAVHNLAAMSSVSASWDAVEATREVNEVAVTGMLATLAELGDRAPAFVQASSSEIFGPVASGSIVDETATLHPASPYAEAKAAAHRAVVAARESGLHATNLVMFGHTSPIHAATFVLPRIARSAAEVALGMRDRIELQDPTVRRDWGAATDYVEAFARAVDAPAGDFVLGTGQVHALRDVVEWALVAAGVPGTPLVATGQARPHDFGDVTADASRAAEVLGWRPRTSLRRVVEQMVAADLARLRSGIEQDVTYLGEETVAS
jgi:GDPmannose 4,6-dehydratase